MITIQNDLHKLTAIVVDDEYHGRENLRKILEDYCPEVSVSGCADSVVRAIELIGTEKPDVVFLDINMPVLDGFDLLKEYDDRTFMAVFVSAHEEFGIRAVKAGATDYLLKPINIKELKQTVKTLLLLKSKKPSTETVREIEKIILPSTHGFNLLSFDDLIRFEADGCYTKVFLLGGKNKIISHTLKDFERILPGELFFRIHKSHLVNISHIKEYSNAGGTYLTMSDGTKVEISRRKAPEFIQKIKEMLKSI